MPALVALTAIALYARQSYLINLSLYFISDRQLPINNKNNLWLDGANFTLTPNT